MCDAEQQQQAANPNCMYPRECSTNEYDCVSEHTADWFQKGSGNVLISDNAATARGTAASAADRTDMGRMYENVGITRVHYGCP